MSNKTNKKAKKERKIYISSKKDKDMDKAIDKIVKSTVDKSKQQSQAKEENPKTTKEKPNYEVEILKAYAFTVLVNALPDIGSNYIWNCVNNSSDKLLELLNNRTDDNTSCISEELINEAAKSISIDLDTKDKTKVGDEVKVQMGKYIMSHYLLEETGVPYEYSISRLDKLIANDESAPAYLGVCIGDDKITDEEVTDFTIRNLHVILELFLYNKKLSSNDISLIESELKKLDEKALFKTLSKIELLNLFIETTLYTKEQTKDEPKEEAMTELKKEEEVKASEDEPKEDTVASRVDRYLENKELDKTTILVSKYIENILKEDFAKDNSSSSILSAVAAEIPPLARISKDVTIINKFSLPMMRDIYGDNDKSIVDELVMSFAVKTINKDEPSLQRWLKEQCVL